MEICGRVWLSLKQCFGFDGDGRREGNMPTVNSMAVMPHYRPKVPLPPLLKDPNLFGLSHEKLVVEETVQIYTFARPTWKNQGAGVVRILSSILEPKISRMVLVRGSVELVGCNHHLSSNSMTIQEPKNNVTVSWACSDKSHIKPEIVSVKFKDEIAAKYFKSKLLMCIPQSIVVEAESGEALAAKRSEVTGGGDEEKLAVQLEEPKQVDVQPQLC